MVWQSHIVKEPVGLQDCCEFLLKQSIVTIKYTIGGSNTKRARQENQGAPPSDLR